MEQEEIDFFFLFLIPFCLFVYLNQLLTHILSLILHVFMWCAWAEAEKNSITPRQSHTKILAETQITKVSHSPCLVFQGLVRAESPSGISRRRVLKF